MCYRFSIDAKAFINERSKQGFSHHCAIGVGHIANNIKKLGNLLQFLVGVIC
jgi:L-arabinose isomerase